MKKLFLLLTVVGMVFTACEGGLGNEDNGGTPSAPKIELSQQNIEVGFESAQYSIGVTSPCSWDATSKNNWIVIDTKSGIAGNEMLKFTTKNNKDEQERKGTITLKNSDYNLVAELYVTQKAFVPDEIIIEFESLTFTSEGGTQEVAVTTNFEYEFSTEADWLTIEKNENGIKVTAPNYAEVENRTTEITISNEKYGISKVIKVVQEAFVPNEMIIEPESLIFEFEGGNHEVTITANFEYKFSEKADWLTIKKSEKGLNISTIPNTKFEERIAEVTISNEKYGVSKAISITQKGMSAESKNVIIYTSSDGKIVKPYKSDVFGANIVSNTYEYEQGVIICDTPITSIGDDAFYYCKSLTSITIPNSVTSIGSWTFYKCSSLTSVTIPNSVTTIGKEAFYNCSSLTSVTIGNGVTSIGEGVFRDCTSLTSVTIPDSVTSIGELAFFNCTSLTSVTIGNSVTSIGGSAFYDCTSLKRVDITDLSAWCKIGFGDWLANPLSNGAKLYLNGSELTNITIPSDITEIKAYAFYYCSSLTSITIPDSVTSIGGQAFWGCTSLTSVTIPNSVTTIGEYAFSGCTSLTSVTIPDSVTLIGEWAFSDCPSLKRVDITDLSAWCKISFGDSYANPLCNGAKLYLNGSELTDITIPSDITEIKSCAFYNCTSLTSITIPDSVTSIGDDAFRNCKSLTSATIGNSVTSIGDDAFYYCKSLTSITIPNSVTSIGSWTFYKCTSLTSVTIPDSVTSIGYEAFTFCTSLTSITIPDSVTSIGVRAFYNCTSLKEVYCKPTTPPVIGDDCIFAYFNNGYYYYIGCKIYVPIGSGEAYKTAQYWGTYANYIEEKEF